MGQFKSDKGAYVHLGYESVVLSKQTAESLGVKTDKGTQMSGRKGVYVNADTVLESLQKQTMQETANVILIWIKQRLNASQGKLQSEPYGMR